MLQKFAPKSDRFDVVGIRFDGSNREEVEAVVGHRFDDDTPSGSWLVRLDAETDEWAIYDDDEMSEMWEPVEASGSHRVEKWPEAMVMKMAEARMAGWSVDAQVKSFEGLPPQLGELVRQGVPIQVMADPSGESCGDAECVDPMCAPVAAAKGGYL